MKVKYYDPTDPEETMTGVVSNLDDDSATIKYDNLSYHDSFAFDNKYYLNNLYIKDDDALIKSSNTVLTMETAQIGNIVERNDENWKFGNQDGHGLGVIYSNKGLYNKDWIWVIWLKDNAVHPYPVNALKLFNDKPVQAKKENLVVGQVVALVNNDDIHIGTIDAISTDTESFFVMWLSDSNKKEEYSIDSFSGFLVY
jgi:hypothetical protein